MKKSTTTKVCRLIAGIGFTMALAVLIACQNPIGEVLVQKGEAENGGTVYETPNTDLGGKMEYPIKPSMAKAGKTGIDPINGKGSWDLFEGAGPFDLIALYNAGHLVRTDEPRTSYTHYIAASVKEAIKSGNASIGAGLSLPLEGVMFSANIKHSQERSGRSAASSCIAGINVKDVTWTERITLRHPRDLLPYFSSTFNRAIEKDSADKESASRLLAEYPPFISLAYDHGLYLQVTLISSRESSSSDSSYGAAVGAGANIIGDIFGGNFNTDYSESASVSELSGNTSFSYELIGGGYRPVWQNMEQAIAELPAVVETLEYYPDTVIGIPSWHDTIPLWSLVAVKNPQLANEIFKLWLSRAAAKALELESSFGGYLETVKFESPGINTINLSLNPMDILMVYAGAPSGGDQGDYYYDYATGFLNLERRQGWNGGDPGQPGPAAFESFQVGAKVNEDGELGMSDRPVNLTLNIKVGSGGRTGTNSAGTNKNGIGGRGSGGEDTVVAIRAMEGAELVLTVHGGSGGGYAHNPTAAAISPADFSGLLEFKSSLGLGTSGGVVNGVKVGADSSCLPGKVIYQILRLN
jgi:hypothetical protein